MNKNGGSMVLSWFPAIVLILLAVVGCSRDPILGFDGVAADPADTTRPRVEFTVPVNGATDVATNAAILATFTKDMAPATIDATTFTVTGPGSTPVSGTVTYSVAARTATFTPDTALDNDTLYTATVTTGATDLAGNQLAGNQAPLPAASDYVWSFTTASAPDTTRPRVEFTAPADGATGVAINTAILATFTKDMAPATIDATTFTVTGPGSTPVSGTVTYSVASRTATFTPDTALDHGTVYTATVTTGATDLAGNQLAGNQAPLPAASDYVWSFTTAAAPAAPDTTRPRVTFTVPADGATGVAINTAINATFTKDMAPATINSTTFTVTGPGSAPVSGTVTYSVAARTATFTPGTALDNDTLYTATVTTGATDLAGNQLAGNQAPLPAASDYVWTFTTALAPDTTRPRVTFTVPEDGATGVAINTAIQATFTEDMAPATINSTTFTVTGPGSAPVSGTVTYSVAARTATFTPSTALDNDTLYTATVTTGATDLAGNQLAGNQAPLPAASDYVWSFTTAVAPDTTPPTVTLVSPADLAVDVCPTDNINATFSEPMDPATISTLTFTLIVTGGQPGEELDAVVTYNVPTRIATLDPIDGLLAGTNYTATVTTGVQDLAGNALESDFVWTFTIDDFGCEPPPPPNILNTAAPFGLFGGTAGMTNQGTQTVINGDIGTTATDTSAVTGFHDTNGDIYTETPSNMGAVNGLIFTCTTSTEGPTSPTEGGFNQASCDIATQARLDAQAAYLELQGLPPGANPGQNLGGLTLAPGVYTAPGGDFLITGSDLTLDAQGDANASWVFQMDTTLTVGAAGAPRSIILANGAQAKNIFWAVGTFATINAAGGGTMVGTIISQSGASFSTAGNTDIVTLNGRILSLGASVTLVDTVINVPAP